MRALIVRQRARREAVGEGEIPDYAVLENPYDGFGDVIEDVLELSGQTYIVGCFEKKNSVFG